MKRFFALLLLALAACSTDPAKLQADLDKVKAVADKANADLAIVAKDGIPIFCQTVTALDGTFKAAAAVSDKVAAQASLEAASYKIVANFCANPPANLAQIPATVFQAAIGVQGAMKAASAQ